MSKNIYNNIYALFKKYNNKIHKKTNIFTIFCLFNKNENFDIQASQTLYSLMELIGNKTDDEFEKLYNKYNTKFILQKSHTYNNTHFNSINNPADLLEKLKYCKDVDFYIEIQIIIQYIINAEIDNNNKTSKKISKKKNIPSTTKRLVWNTNIGEEIGKAKCLCCNTTDITQMSFHCGHIIAEAKGGANIVSNLRPICQNCNSSMGCKNMDEFIKTLK